MQKETNPSPKKILGEPPWPSKEEVDAYWKRKEKGDMETMIELLDKMASTMRNLLDAVSGLHKIVLHQQGQIDRLLKHETDQPI
jgi:hypothetical protein